MNRLARWLKDTGTSQETFAASIGAHQTQVSRYVTGVRRPSRRLRKAIEDATGGKVPVSSWSQTTRTRRAA